MGNDSFRFCADIFLILSLLIIPVKICVTKSSAGVSARTQFLLALSYLCRYSDLFIWFAYYSLYLTIMKIVIPTIVMSTLFLIYLFRDSYDKNNDSFRLEILIIPAIVLGLNYNYNFELPDLLWSFSLFMEAFAVLPQIFMLAKTGKPNRVIYFFFFVFGTYRGLYVIHWLYKYYSSDEFDSIAYSAGLILVVICYGWYFIRKLFSFVLVDNSLAQTVEKVLNRGKPVQLNTISEAVTPGLKVPSPLNQA